MYFFYPETKQRSLEEMDMIFAKSGWLSVVPNSLKEPNHYDKNGNLLIPFEVEEYRRFSRASLDDKEAGGNSDSNES